MIFAKLSHIDLGVNNIEIMHIYVYLTSGWTYKSRCTTKAAPILDMKESWNICQLLQNRNGVIKMFFTVACCLQPVWEIHLSQLSHHDDLLFKWHLSTALPVLSGFCNSLHNTKQHSCQEHAVCRKLLTISSQTPSSIGKTSIQVFAADSVLMVDPDRLTWVIPTMHLREFKPTTFCKLAMKHSQSMHKPTVFTKRNGGKGECCQFTAAINLSKASEPFSSIYWATELRVSGLMDAKILRWLSVNFALAFWLSVSFASSFWTVPLE